MEAVQDEIGLALPHNSNHTSLWSQAPGLEEAIRIILDHELKQYLAPIHELRERLSAVKAQLQEAPLDQLQERLSTVEARLQEAPFDAPTDPNNIWDLQERLSTLEAQLQDAPVYELQDRLSAVESQLQEAPVYELQERLSTVESQLHEAPVHDLHEHELQYACDVPLAPVSLNISKPCSGAVSLNISKPCSGVDESLAILPDSLLAQRVEHLEAAIFPREKSATSLMLDGNGSQMRRFLILRWLLMSPALINFVAEVFVNHSLIKSPPWILRVRYMWMPLIVLLLCAHAGATVEVEGSLRLLWLHLAIIVGQLTYSHIVLSQQSSGVLGREFGIVVAFFILTCALLAFGSGLRWVMRAGPSHFRPLKAAGAIRKVLAPIPPMLFLAIEGVVCDGDFDLLKDYSTCTAVITANFCVMSHVVLAYLLGLLLLETGALTMTKLVHLDLHRFSALALLYFALASFIPVILFASRSLPSYETLVAVLNWAYTCMIFPALICACLAARYAQSDEARLQETILGHHKRARSIISDGACQFRAVADQIFGSQEEHLEVRLSAIKQLRSDPCRYADFADGNWLGYLHEMAQPYTWGDNVTLQALADAFNAKIKILTSYPEQPLKEVSPAKGGRPEHTIWIGFNAEKKHYISLEDAAATARSRTHTTNSPVQGKAIGKQRLLW